MKLNHRDQLLIKSKLDPESESNFVALFAALNDLNEIQESELGLAINVDRDWELVEFLENEFQSWTQIDGHLYHNDDVTYILHTYGRGSHE